MEEIGPTSTMTRSMRKRGHPHHDSPNPVRKLRLPIPQKTFDDQHLKLSPQMDAYQSPILDVTPETISATPILNQDALQFQSSQELDEETSNLEIFDDSNQTRWFDPIFKLWRWITGYQPPPSVRIYGKKAENLSNFVNIASQQYGAQVEYVTDEHLGFSDNILKDGLHTKTKEFSHSKKKILEDSEAWETHRRREIGHEWCIFKLGLKGYIYGIDIDLTGKEIDCPPRISVEAINCSALTRMIEELPDEKRGNIGQYLHSLPYAITSSVDYALEEKLRQKQRDWIELLHPNQANFCNSSSGPIHHFSINNPSLIGPYTHIRINLYPDGAITRVRLYGEFLPTSLRKSEIESEAVIDLLSAKSGGNLLAFDRENVSRGHPKNVICSKKSEQGWQTARSYTRPPLVTPSPSYKIFEKNWAIFKMAYRGVPKSIILNCNEMQGEAPQFIRIESIDCPGLHRMNLVQQQNIVENPTQFEKLFGFWQQVVEVPMNSFKNDSPTSNSLRKYSIKESNVATHLRISLVPDGGIAELRILGILQV